MNVFDPIRTNEPKVRNHIYIPSELKAHNIWLIASDENGFPSGKIPTIINDSDKLQRFSKKIGLEPMAYSIAETMYEHYGYDLGLCIQADYQYCVIDLDYKNLDTESANRRLDAFKQILYAFKDFYMEVSQSGTGFHIIAKAELLIARNFRQHGIEIYSYRDRFILLTGNRIFVNKDSDGNIVIDEVYKLPPTQKSVAQVNKPIAYCDNILKELLAQLGSASQDDFENNEYVLIESEETKSDEEVFNEIICTPSFSERLLEILSFNNDTDWSNTRYPSASEAVLNFVSIVCRFTDSNEQVRRLFRMQCEISQRDKYTKNDYYINRCLTIVRSELDTTQLDDFIDAAVKKYHQEQSDMLERRMVEETELMKQLAELGDDEININLAEIESEYAIASRAFSDIIYPENNIIGELARYSHDIAPHKLKEAHIAAALAIIAGICGRQVRWRGSSTNLAIILVAPSTLGKEGVAKTLAAVCRNVSSVHGDKFFNFDKIASGGALRTLMSSCEYGSVVTTVPEFAQLIEQMKQGKENALGGLKAELLDAITKNSKDSVYGGSIHANSENDRANMIAPAFTMVGDTVPDFYEGISEEMCSGGFLSRFIIIEHFGHTKHKADSNAHKVVMPKGLIDDLCQIVQRIILFHEQGHFEEVDVKCPLVAFEVNRYEEFINAKFNAAEKNEAKLQIFGRMFVKTMQIAALLGFVRNVFNPEITMEDFVWARNLIMRDVFRMEQRINEGEIGVSEKTCRLKMETFINKVVNKPEARDRTTQYKFGAMLDCGIIPRTVVSSKMQGKSFVIGNMSNTRTMDFLFDNMVKNGDIDELSGEDKVKLGEVFNRNLRGTFYLLNDVNLRKKLRDVVKKFDERKAKKEATLKGKE